MKKMRFNEKLARDVYIFIGNLYNQNIFLNIQESEQNHINAILELFTKYLIEDPIIVDEIGVFPVLDFQELYDSYISESESSTQEAIEVGIAIEELIIADLEYLLTITDNTDILKIYEKLLDSSKNHLLQLLNHVKPEIVNNSFYMKRSIDQKSNSNTNVNSKKRSKR